MRKTRAVQIGTDGRGYSHGTGNHILDRLTWHDPDHYQPHHRTNRCVYFVHAPQLGRIKIGTTTNLKRRFRDLQRHPQLREVALAMLGYIDGGRSVERLIHEKFKAHRITGEWFDDAILNDARELIQLDATWFGE